MMSRSRAMCWHVVMPAVAMFASLASGQTTWYVSDCDGSGDGSAGMPFCTIQDAVDAASNLDTILVGPGEYVENVDITLKAVTLRSTDGPWATIVRATKDGTRRPMWIDTCPPPYTVIEGLTLTGGDAVIGGGLLIRHTEGEVRNCIIRDNRAVNGGGYFNFGAFPIFSNCIFHGNVATGSGGAVYNDHSYETLLHCLVYGNEADLDGGGLRLANPVVLANSIIWGNVSGGCTVESAQVWQSSSANPVIRHCCIEGLSTLAGNGNIGDDPGFVDAAGGDFRLIAGSPCHDAADNGLTVLPVDIEDVPRFLDDPDVDDTGLGDGFIADLGPFEFGGDCNGNGIPDDEDVAAGTSMDCNDNELPDECEPDCNANGVADPCDIASGFSMDCAGDGIPDDCEPDCDGNEIADSCDILDGSASDCNANGIPDLCDLAGGNADDENGNGVPDQCERPEAVAEGPRYLQLRPTLGPEPVALELTAPAYPCLQMFVLTDGTLSGEPFYLLPHEWHEFTLHVRGADIIPGTTYEARAVTRSGVSSPPATVTTWAWGDVDDNGVATFEDIFLVVQGVSGNFCQVTTEQVDLDNCTPNGVINIADALRAVHAFQGLTFIDACGDPCGP